MNTFNELYGTMVDTFIARTSIRTRNVHHKNCKWLIYESNDNAFCMTKAEYYIIPAEIVHLLGNTKTLPKLHALALNVELVADIAWASVNIYEFCDSPWFNAKCDVCDIKLREFMYVDGLNISCGGCAIGKCEFKEVHITDFNVLDWVQIMHCELGKFYVNCNIESKYYGKVLRGHESEVGTMFNISDLSISDICNWITTTGNIDNTAVDRFLDSTLYGETNRYIIQHQDDSYDDYTVNMYVENLKQNNGYDKFTKSRVNERDYLKHAEMHIQSARRKYSTGLIKFICIQLRDVQLYTDYRLRTLDAYLHHLKK